MEPIKKKSLSETVGSVLKYSAYAVLLVNVLTFAMAELKKVEEQLAKKSSDE